MSKTRAVITGLGAITPLGKSVREYWDGLTAGRSGVRRIVNIPLDHVDLPCKIAGEVPDFNPEDYIAHKEARRLTRSSQMALAAAQEAVRDAGLPGTMPDPERAGVVFGTAIGGVDRIADEIEVMRTRGYKRVDPFSTAIGLPNAPAFVIAREFQCLGVNSTISTACATSTQTIGEAAVHIERGLADVIIAGGTEAMIKDYTLAGFSQMRALPTSFNDCPEKASRPFDAKREGFIMSEGAGAVVLESEAHALARGARIYAEVKGHASSADGFHFAALDPEAAGAIRAMRWALQAANVGLDEVDYIHAHGSSTPANDSTETKAIKAVFGDLAYAIPVSSTKSMIGHPLGAAGVLEAIAGILAIRHKCLPPTINYEYPDPECDLDYVPNTARAHNVRTFLSNSFGLGGQNACLVVGEYLPA
jgi:beta-ketoacyl-acyl-carrier-protein synthase II